MFIETKETTQAVAKSAELLREVIKQTNQPSDIKETKDESGVITRTIKSGYNCQAMQNVLKLK